jgi:hypothetical protein
MNVAASRRLVAYCSDGDGEVIAPYHGYTVRVGQRVGVLLVDRTVPFGRGVRHPVAVDFTSSSFYWPASAACQGVIDRLPFEPSRW